MGLGARWWTVNATPRPLRPEKQIRYPSYRRLGGPQGRSRRVEKMSPPTGVRPPDRPARSESLYRLSYRDPKLCLGEQKISYRPLTPSTVKYSLTRHISTFTAKYTSRRMDRNKAIKCHLSVSQSTLRLSKTNAN